MNDGRKLNRRASIVAGIGGGRARVAADGGSPPSGDGRGGGDDRPRDLHRLRGGARRATNEKDRHDGGHRKRSHVASYFPVLVTLRMLRRRRRYAQYRRLT